MRISIQDTGMDLSVGLSASGGYAPDCMDDLTTRAIATYKEALAGRLEALAALTNDDEGEAPDA